MVTGATKRSVTSAHDLLGTREGSLAIRHSRQRVAGQQTVCPHGSSGRTVVAVRCIHMQARRGVLRVVAGPFSGGKDVDAVAFVDFCIWVRACIDYGSGIAIARTGLSLCQGVSNPSVNVSCSLAHVPGS